MKKWIHNRFFYLALLLGTGFWIIDSIIDGLFFSDGGGIYQSIISPEPVEIYIRLLNFLLFIIYGIYTGNKRYEILQSNHLLKIKQKELENEISKRLKIENKLRKMTDEDPLTGIFNRRKGIKEIEKQIHWYKRYKHPFSIIICDLDNFKEVNDNEGHIAGDKVLKSFCKVIINNIRKTDIFVRYGGEEFLIILPFIQEKECYMIAQKIRVSIEKKVKNKTKKITASFGYSQYRKNDSFESLVARADKALYKAKESGKNRVMPEFIKISPKKSKLQAI